MDSQMFLSAVRLWNRLPPPDDRLSLTASAFNRASIWAVLAALTAMQSLPFSSLTVSETVTSTHCSYRQKDGMAVIWPERLVTKRDCLPTQRLSPYPITNWDKRRATSLIVITIRYYWVLTAAQYICFTLCSYSNIYAGLLGLGLEAKFSGLGLEAFGLVQSQGQSDQYSSKHSVSRYN